MDMYIDRKKPTGNHGHIHGKTSTSQATDHADDHPQNQESRLNRKTSSKISNHWYPVERNVQSPTSGSASPIPSYNFPGTWDAAYHTTSHALRQVTAASSSYIISLSHSGIKQAGWSIGSALASMANKSALSLVGWVADVSGVDTEALPRGIKSWSKGKEKLDEARKRARDVEESRLARRRNEFLVGNAELPGEMESKREPAAFEDKRGMFVLDMHDDDEESFLEARSSQTLQERKGELVYKASWANMRHVELDGWWSEEEDDEFQQRENVKRLGASSSRFKSANWTQDGFTEQTLTNAVFMSSDSLSKRRVPSSTSCNGGMHTLLPRSIVLPDAANQDGREDSESLDVSSSSSEEEEEDKEKEKKTKELFLNQTTE